MQNDTRSYDFLLRSRPPPRSTLFPSPTLFRSGRRGGLAPLVSFRRLDPGRAAVRGAGGEQDHQGQPEDRKSTRLNSSHANISYAVFCLTKNRITIRVIQWKPMARLRCTALTIR